MFQASKFSIFGTLSKRAEPKQEMESTAATSGQAEAQAPATLVADAIESRHPGCAGSETAQSQHLVQPASAAAGENMENQFEAASASAPTEFRPTASEPSVKDRRSKRRALISAPVRVRSVNSTRNALNDVTTTENASRVGISLRSSDPAYYRGMDVKVTFPYTKSSGAVQAEQLGRVVRVTELPDGQRSIAISLGLPSRADEFILSNGETVRTLPEALPEAPRVTLKHETNSSRPMVLILDHEEAIRESLKCYLKGEGYDVIAVASAREAREVLGECTPALVVAEIEGEGMPGYDICVHCKSTPRLQRIPVVLMTNSAYPSDYASAHSLGAVVCIAKPYRQERLGNVVKLLAPPKAKEMCEPPRPADPTRRHLGITKQALTSAPNTKRRFLFFKK